MYRLGCKQLRTLISNVFITFVKRKWNKLLQVGWQAKCRNFAIIIVKKRKRKWRSIWWPHPQGFLMAASCRKTEEWALITHPTTPLPCTNLPISIPKHWLVAMISESCSHILSCSILLHTAEGKREYLGLFSLPFAKVSIF